MQPPPEPSDAPEPERDATPEPEPGTPPEPAPIERPAWDVALLFGAVTLWTLFWFTANGVAQNAPRTPETYAALAVALIITPLLMTRYALAWGGFSPERDPRLPPGPRPGGKIESWLRIDSGEGPLLPPVGVSASTLIWAAFIGLLIDQQPAAVRQLLFPGHGADGLPATFIALLVGGLLVYAYTALVLRARGSHLRRLGWSTEAAGRRAALGYVQLILPMLTSLVISAGLHNFFPAVRTPVNPAADWAMEAHGAQVILLFLLASVVAPAVEELLFRGLLFRGLALRYGETLGAVAASMVFAGMHPQLPVGFPPLFTVGFILCLVYRRTGSLVPCILIHGVSNGLVLLLARGASGGF